MSVNKIVEEYEHLVATNKWLSFYQQIGRVSKLTKYSSIEAEKPENRPCNRYRDVSPYDHSRVELASGTRKYINANFVTVKQAGRRYILTQGPLKHTVTDFWMMAWEQKSKAIVMLNKIIEKNERKCQCYWPNGVGNVAQYGIFIVKLLREQNFEAYTVRQFMLQSSRSAEARKINQYHYTTWPDFGVPSSATTFLEFLKRVRDVGALENDVGPAIVHCSAGIGRSGTFCLVDSAMLLIEMEGQVNIEQLLVDMRRYRAGLVQTPEQLRFAYKAIVEGVTNEKIDCLEESFYEECYDENPDEEDDVPPPPPPRLNSLASPPTRPLPSIPGSLSLGELDAEIEIVSLLCSDDSDTDTKEQESTSSLRQRRGYQEPKITVQTEEPSQETDYFSALTRSIYRPLTVTIGLLVAGMAIYSFAKH